MKQVINKQNNQYFVVEIRFNEELRQFDIINRWKVLYQNKNQCVIKKSRGEVKALNIARWGFYQTLGTNFYYVKGYVNTFSHFLKDYENIRNRILNNKIPGGKYILIQRRFYNEFKEKLYSLSENSNYNKLRQVYERSKNLLKGALYDYQVKERAIREKVEEAERYQAIYEDRKRIFEKAKSKLINFQNSIEDKTIKEEINKLLNEN